MSQTDTNAAADANLNAAFSAYTDRRNALAGAPGPLARIVTRLFSR